MTTIYRYRKETKFAQPPEAIWPFLADTARLNEMTGSPPYQVADRIDPDGRTRRAATAKAGPLRLQWDERFGEWQENRWLTQERQFKNGPFRHFKVHAKLDPEGTGSRLASRPRSNAPVRWDCWQSFPASWTASSTSASRRSRSSWPKPTWRIKFSAQARTRRRRLRASAGSMR